MSLSALPLDDYTGYQREQGLGRPVHVFSARAKLSCMLYGSADASATAVCGYCLRRGLTRIMVANRNPAPSANV